MSLICEKYWKDTVYNGSEVKPVYRECLSRETPYDDYATVHKVLLDCNQHEV